MDRFIKFNNGIIAGMQIAEIKEIPHYKLINENSLDRANIEIKGFYADLLRNFCSQNKDMMASLELLFVSEEVDNQAYKAQVRIFLIIRVLGIDVNGVNVRLNTYREYFTHEFRDKYYDIIFIDNKEDIDDFENLLRKTSKDVKLSVAKKEEINSFMLVPDGYLYYTHIPEKVQIGNIDRLINSLSQYPNICVMIQIIPSQYTDIEKNGIGAMNQQLSMIAAQMISRMMRPDPTFQRIQQYYQIYQQQIINDVFLYNFVICGPHNATESVAGDFINVLESDIDKHSTPCFEYRNIDFFDDIYSSYAYLPWQMNKTLIQNYRDINIWGRSNSPQLFSRFRQLITLDELLPVFKIPLNDEMITGMKTRHTRFSRVQLDEKILSEENFKIGRIENASKGEDSTHAGVPIDQFAKHGLICGMPGSGKTVFSLGLLLQFWKRFNIPFLAIEPTKTEYRSLIDLIPELRIFTPGKNKISPFLVNPFIPPKGVTVESYTPSLITAFKAAFSMPNPLPDIFLAAVNDCYAIYGWNKDSTIDDPNVKMFGMYEFIKVFKNNIEHSNYKGESKANIESAGVVRLVSMIEQNSNIYDTIHTVSIEEILEKPTVLELNAIADKQQKSLIMALILIQFCAYTKNNIRGDGKLKKLLLIDEAHVLLGGSSGGDGESADAQSTTVETIEDMIKEIRAYGMGIVIADQSPTSIGKEIVANTDVKIVFRLIEKSNRDLIRTATNMGEMEYDALADLGVGEAYFGTGKIKGLLKIRTYNIFDSQHRQILTNSTEMADMRTVIMDDELEGCLHFWDSHKDLLIPYNECQNNCYCKNECDLALRTNADYLANRLINLRIYQLDTKEKFLKYLANMDPDINKLVDGDSRIQYSVRLANCVKIKFLRKAFIKNNYGLSEESYINIVRNPKFLQSNSDIS